MEEMPVITIEDVLGELGFRVRWSVVSHWADFKVYRIVGGSDKPLFRKKDYHSSDENVESIKDADLYLDGHIKWDGCSTIIIKENHFCGASDFKLLQNLMKYLYTRAATLMGREDLADPWIH